MKKWYTIQAKAGNAKSAEIHIFDEIGFWGVSAQSFGQDLKALGDVEDLDVFINSPGGSVMDGLAIYNMLRQHPANVTVKVMGVAASAASFIAMAGDKIVMPENSFMMIHNPMSAVFGNAQEMREIADTLDKIAASLIGIYVARTGKSEADVKALLDAETWMTAAEAKDLGFIDEILPEMKVAASFDVENLPENIKALFKREPVNQAVEPPLPERIRALADEAGVSDYLPVFALHNSLADAQGAISNAREIVSLCSALNAADKIKGFIDAATPIAKVREMFLTARALADENVIVDTQARNPSSAAPTPQPAALKTADVWAARRKTI